MKALDSNLSKVEWDVRERGKEGGGLRLHLKGGISGLTSSFEKHKSRYQSFGVDFICKKEKMSPANDAASLS